MATNLFQDLHKALTEFKKFLDDNVGTITPAIRALRQLIPQISDLLSKLSDLMKKLKAEIDKLDVKNIPGGLAQVSTFTQMIKAFLDSMKKLLPDEASSISDVESVVDVVAGLPSLDQLKVEIDQAIDAIIAHLDTLSKA